MVVAAIALIAIVALLAVWLVPRWQARRWAAQGITGQELAELENGARGTVVQIVGGVALILTFVATWLQISDTRDATDRTLRLTAAQQETERFTRAVDQLGSKRVEVRVGGIYGLQQTAEDSPQRRPAVAHLMLAFLRSHHPRRAGDARIRAVDERIRALQHGAATAGPCELTTVQPWPDTQAALTVLLGIPPSARGPLDLASLDLVGVRVPGADLTDADLQLTALQGAYLAGARFGRAKVYDADLRLACLRDTRFDGAYVYGRREEGTFADFTGADLTRACGAPDALLDDAITDDGTSLPEHPINRIGCQEP